MSKLNKEKLLRRVQRLLNGKKYENCLKTANKALKNYSEETSVYLAKMEALFHLEKFDELTETVKHYFKNVSNDEDSYVMICDKFESLELGLMEKLGYDSISEAKQGSKLEFATNMVIQLNNEALKLYPESCEFAITKARRVFLEEGAEKLVEYVDSFSSTDLHWKELMYFKENTCRFSRNCEESLNTCNKILEVSFDLETLFRKIWLLRLMKKDDEAIGILDEMIAKDNNKNWALAAKGLYYGERDNQKAMEFIDEAIKNDPEYGYAYYAKAYILFILGKYDDTSDTLDKAFSLDESLLENPWVLFFLAEFAEAEGDLGSALEYLSHIDVIDYVYSATMEFRSDLYELMEKEIKKYRKKDFR